jgi:hypothetical protein
VFAATTITVIITTTITFVVIVVVIIVVIIVVVLGTLLCGNECLFRRCSRCCTLLAFVIRFFSNLLIRFGIGFFSSTAGIIGFV